MSEEKKQVLAPLPNLVVGEPRRTIEEQIKLISQTYLPRAVETVFECPEVYMKEVEKGWAYSWAKDDRYLKARLRSGDYQLVDQEELRDDCSVAVEIKTVAGEEVVKVGDLILVKVPPEANDRLYKHKAILGLLNATGHTAFSQLQSAAETFGIEAQLEDPEIPEADRIIR
jgi:hypothetical protein